MLTLLPCPECRVPAEVTERFSLPSTDGPVDHLALSCAAGHHFKMAIDRLPAQSQQELNQTMQYSQEHHSTLAAAAGRVPDFHERDLDDRRGQSDPNPAPVRARAGCPGCGPGYGQN